MSDHDRTPADLQPRQEPNEIQHSNYEDAFELTGHGKFSYLALACGGLIFSYTALEMTGIAYVITPSECDLHFSVLQKAMVNCSVFIGIMATSICWGSISDRYGRKRIMFPALLGSVSASFLSSLSTQFWLMFTLRVLTGCLVSACYATSLVYLSELHTNDYRDTALSIVVTFDQITAALLPILAWGVLPGNWSFQMLSISIKPWRVFMWLWGIFGLAGAAILYILPESPRLVLAKDGPNATMPILATMYAWNNNKSKEDFPVKSMIVVSAHRLVPETGFRPILKNIMWLLRPPLRRCFLLTHFTMLVIYILTNGLYIWMPALINEMLKDTTKKSTICDVIYVKYMQAADDWFDFEHLDPKLFSLMDTKAECDKNFVKTIMYPVTIGIEFIYLIPYVLVVVMIHRFKHVNLYAFISVICASCLALSSLVNQIAVATICMSLSICCGSCVSVISAMAVEAFPTKLRALAMCTMYMCGQMGTVFGICSVSIMDDWICPTLFFVIVGLMLVVLLLLYWPDLHVLREEMELHDFTY